MTINTDFSGNSCGESQRREWEVAALARQQHGVVAFSQLVALGLSQDTIQYRARTGRLHRIHRGVYAVGHPRLTRRGNWMAAALACGPAAVLSHRTAAALHGVLWPRDGWPHVTVPATGRAKRNGIFVHQVKTIADSERTVIDAIPATSLARSLLDLARTNDRLLPHAIDEAADKELLDMTAIAELGPHRKGMAALKAAIAAYEPTPHWTRSRLEKRFFKLMRKHGIPLPAVNQWIEGYEVDMLWREQELVVEIDSDLHDRPSARRKDPIRDAKLQLAGYRVYRVPETELILRPDEVAATVKQFLTRTEARPAR
jgi:very-short-patch-repair endonuclease